ncbi:MAG TPA: mechanosensitive ion channel domain-containing protein [Gammaproteobacteria bacterium]|nr:mechanosensitive ion channel domain-containing protein [Gammaproteobacteria bacterium]
MGSVTDSINNQVTGWLGVLKNYFNISDNAAMAVMTVIIFLAGLILFYVVRPIILSIVYRIANKEKAAWMKAAYNNFVFHRIAWLIPGFVVLIFAPLLIDSSMPHADILSKSLIMGSEIYLTGVVAAVISALLNTLQDRFNQYKLARRYSIKSYIQVLKIILFSLTAIVIAAILLERSPIYLLTGLGAMTAVGMLIFKDSIMGFAASVQLSANDIIRVGDWVEISKYGVDGTVIDISLNTIKIQNFDKTIITIPSYAILSEGVKNWRGMSESGGRRIKRNITIDINSIKFCDAECVSRLSKLLLLQPLLEKYLKNDNRNVDQDALKLLGADTRGLTNLTLYRLYLNAYLAAHPAINTKMSFLIRELQDQNYGVPLEIYIFTKTTDWVEYEAIQSDIIEYMYSVLPLFELQAFQTISELKTTK